jgi:transcriptional regulator NrdR family protein
MRFRETTAKYIKELMRAKTIHEVVAKELKEAHLKKLEAESAVEYARSIVIYNEARIKRLEQRLTEHTEEGDYA